MSTLDDVIDEIKEKIDVIPNINKESINDTLKILPHLEEKEQQQLIADITDYIDAKYHELKLSSKNPVLSFPNEENSVGEFPIGYVCTGDEVLYPFELTAENLRENIFVTARAGHGKTTFIFHCVDFLIKNKIKFIFFDWKNDYRTLAQKYSDILVIKWSDLRFNPLTNAPEGIEIKTWWRVVLDVLSHSQGLLMATPSYILQIVEELYEEKKGEINFKDVEEYLRTQHEDSRKKDEYAAVAENRIYNINQALDKVLNVRHGFDVKDLFNKKVIIEMSPLDFPIASFLIQTLIMHEFYRRLINNIRMNRKCTLQEFKDLFSLVVLDEAQNTQYSGQERSLVSEELSPPPLTKFFSQSRELLMGTISATQFPQLIMDAFKNNAGTKIIGNLTESDIQRKMASSLGLDRDDEKILGRLDKGCWVATVSGRTKPFLLKTPEVERGDLIAEEDILQRTKPMLNDLMMKQQEVESKMFLHKVEKSSSKAHVPELTKESWMVLDYVFNHPFTFQKQVSKALGLSGRKTVEVRKNLEQRKLITIDRFPITTYPSIHYVLTKRAIELLRTLNKDSKKINFWKYLTNGNPSYWHKCNQFLMAGVHERLGCQTKKEFALPDGRRADLFAVRSDGLRKVIEIEDNTKDLENKLKVLNDDVCDELILLYRDATSLRYARAKLMEMEFPDNKVLWAGLANDYFKILYGVIKELENSGNSEKTDSSTPESNMKRKLGGNKEEKE